MSSSAVAVMIYEHMNSYAGSALYMCPGILSPQTMREICKEEDYAFLEKVRDSRGEEAEQAKLEEDKLREHHEERVNNAEPRFLKSFLHR